MKPLSRSSSDTAREPSERLSVLNLWARIQPKVHALRRLSSSDVVVAAICAALAMLAGLLAMFASQDGWSHPSALVKISDQDPLAGLVRSADPHFRFVTLV